MMGHEGGHAPSLATIVACTVAAAAAAAVAQSIYLAARRVYLSLCMLHPPSPNNAE